jgi:hypothetical protein
MEKDLRAEIEIMQSSLERLRSDAAGRRLNRSKHSAMARMTYFDICRAELGGEDPRSSRYDEAVRSQWRYGEMVRSQLEIILPNLITDMWEDLHDQFELNYSLLDLFRTTNHSDLVAMRNQAHADSNVLFSALQSMESCICGALNTLIDEVGSLVPDPPGPSPDILFVELVPASANAQPGSTAVTFTANVSGSSGSFTNTWSLDGVALIDSGISYTTPGSLPVGSHTVSVTVNDDVTGETAGASSALVVTSDPTPPVEGSWIDFNYINNGSTDIVSIEVRLGSEQGIFVWGNSIAAGEDISTDHVLLANESYYVHIYFAGSASAHFNNISYWPVAGSWSPAGGGVGASYCKAIINMGSLSYARLSFN